MAFVCGGLFTDVSLAETSQQEMLRQLEMLEQLDDMDRQTFNRLTDEADSCAGNLNFTCVKQKLADARPLIIDDRMQQRFAASEEYHQTMQDHAVELISQTMAQRPLATFKEACPDPFADYSSYESESNSMSWVSDRWLERQSEHDEFVACSDAFNNIYDFNAWSSSLAEMQSLQKQLDTNTGAGIHKLSRQSEIRSINNYIDDEEATYQRALDDYMSQLAFLARKANSNQSSGDWMTALNSTLQTINNDMQASVDSHNEFMAKINRMREDSQRQKRQREQQQAQARREAEMRRQQQIRQQQIRQQQIRQQQLERQRQQQLAANNKPTHTYTRGPEQHRTIGNSTGSVNLGGGPQNTQTGAVRFDFQGDGNGSAGSSSNNGNTSASNSSRNSGGNNSYGSSTGGNASTDDNSTKTGTGSGQNQKKQQRQQEQEKQAAELKRQQERAKQSQIAQLPATQTRPKPDPVKKPELQPYTGGINGCVELLEAKRRPGSSVNSSCSEDNRYSTSFRFRNDCSFPVNIYIEIDYDDGTTKTRGEYGVRSGRVATTVSYCGLSDYAFHYEETNESFRKRSQ